MYSYIYLVYYDEYVNIAVLQIIAILETIAVLEMTKLFQMFQMEK